MGRQLDEGANLVPAPQGPPGAFGFGGAVEVPTRPAGPQSVPVRYLGYVSIGCSPLLKVQWPIDVNRPEIICGICELGTAR